MENQKGSILSALEVLETMKNSMNEVNNKSQTTVTNIVSIDNYEEDNDIKITSKGGINIPSQPATSSKNVSPKSSTTNLNNKPSATINKKTNKVLIKFPTKTGGNLSPKHDSSATNDSNNGIKTEEDKDKNKPQLTRSTTAKGINMITIKNFNINVNIKDNKDFSNIQTLTNFQNNNEKRNISPKGGSPVVTRTFYKSPTQKTNVLSIKQMLIKTKLSDKNIVTVKNNPVTTSRNTLNTMNIFKGATSQSPGEKKTLVTKKLGNPINNTPKLPLIKKK